MIYLLVDSMETEILEFLQIVKIDNVLMIKYIQK